jgi:pimeloyl-ACP methyl ester carboxylesterase
MINVVRSGSGPPLLLVHGLGGSLRSWDPIAPALAEARELVAIDLPGHGGSPAEPDSGTFAGLVRSVEEWLDKEKLTDVDAVGSSMGARLVLELARKGMLGDVVALNPGGFWQGWERTWVKVTLGASVRLLRGISPALPALSRMAAARTALLAQLSARPWALPPALVDRELRSFAATPTFDPLLDDLAWGPLQEGPAHPAAGRLTIGWGRHDRLCLPVQAQRAAAAFPTASLCWYEKSGHFPMWDEPGATVATILAGTGQAVGGVNGR